VRGRDDTPENAALQEDLIGVRPYLIRMGDLIENNWGRTNFQAAIDFVILWFCDFAVLCRYGVED
jgi:hypothetical protein